ncbi:elongation factor 4 [Platysternon megacephalum]|uniref:Elongation factor 4 n=1 Tax=Platysternon megacephalum TaxID=55544 RepID=A0A4D9DNF4_9SAUR|nr:elongation factor 4 [Platysternon megacephalum]
MLGESEHLPGIPSSEGCAHITAHTGPGVHAPQGILPHRAGREGGAQHSYTNTVGVLLGSPPLLHIHHLSPHPEHCVPIPPPGGGTSPCRLLFIWLPRHQPHQVGHGPKSTPLPPAVTPTAGTCMVVNGPCWPRAPHLTHCSQAAPSPWLPDTLDPELPLCSTATPQLPRYSH